jgi:hypothetical protein
MNSTSDEFEYPPVLDVGPIIEFKARVRAHRTYSKRDTEFCGHTNNLYYNCEASHRGVGTELRAVCVIAQAGSGKTSMIRHHLARLPYFKPTVDEFGDEVSPILCVKLKPSSTGKSMLRQLLKAMQIYGGYSKANESELVDLVVGHMKDLGYRYLFIDELQHGARGTKDGYLKQMQDALRGVIDHDDWPVHAILAGTEEVLPILKEPQLRRRTYKMRLQPLSLKYVDIVKTLMNNVIVKAAGMNFSFDDDDEIEKRLMHAANYAMGTAILLLQEACFDAFIEGKATIDIATMEKIYRIKSGCIRPDNIFLVDNFESIRPINSLSDMLLGVAEDGDHDASN